MSKSFRETAEFRNASFWQVDLSGSIIRACAVNDVRIVGSEVNNLRVDGHPGRAGTVIVDGVDVTAYVDAELDRQFPERVQMREMRTPEDFRQTWQTTEQLWDETIARARRLPAAALNERVDDEWSFVETLRHLIFATDVWIGRMMHNEVQPFAEIGLPNEGDASPEARAMGIAAGASPSLDDVLEVHAQLFTVIEEHIVHRRYSVRDLTTLEQGAP